VSGLFSCYALVRQALKVYDCDLTNSNLIPKKIASGDRKTENRLLLKQYFGHFLICKVSVFGSESN
ncbi:hypothetical protein, partial [Kamptonema formosum]|uniref:hypothetical protein n=1 Tax=Kamptonema formosum TaxID=331992 RepID=UPI001F3F9472